MLPVLLALALVQPTDPLRTLRPGHPRLILLDDDLPRLRALIRQDAQARTIYEHLAAEARTIEAAPPLNYELVQGRLLHLSRLCVDRIYTLALLYRLDGDRRHLLLALEEWRDALPIYRDQCWWAINRFNWNLVCNRGVGLGALAVAEDEPALASYAPDGGWAEGPDYWHYASR